jgi:hypothetical protein
VLVWHDLNRVTHAAAPASGQAADETDAKVALVLAHGVRAERGAASRFVSSSELKRVALAGYHQRIEALRMFGRRVAGISVMAFKRDPRRSMLPRVAYVDKHACAPYRQCVLRWRLMSRPFSPHRYARAHWLPLLLVLHCPHALVLLASIYVCRSHWDGSVNTLLTVSTAQVQGLVGAQEPFEHFVHVSGAAALDRAFAHLNARQGALLPALVDCTVSASMVLIQGGMFGWTASLRACRISRHALAPVLTDSLVS